MADIIDVNVPAISTHLSNIFDENELYFKATVSKMEIVQNEGERSVTRNPALQPRCNHLCRLSNKLLNILIKSINRGEIPFIKTKKNKLSVYFYTRKPNGNSSDKRSSSLGLFAFIKLKSFSVLR